MGETKWGKKPERTNEQSQSRAMQVPRQQTAQAPTAPVQSTSVAASIPYAVDKPKGHDASITINGKNFIAAKVSQKRNIYFGILKNPYLLPPNGHKEMLYSTNPVEQYLQRKISSHGRTLKSDKDTLSSRAWSFMNPIGNTKIPVGNFAVATLVPIGPFTDPAKKGKYYTKYAFSKLQQERDIASFYIDKQTHMAFLMEKYEEQYTDKIKTANSTFANREKRIREELQNETPQSQQAVPLNFKLGMERRKLNFATKSAEKTLEKQCSRLETFMRESNGSRGKTTRWALNKGRPSWAVSHFSGFTLQENSHTEIKLLNGFYSILTQPPQEMQYDLYMYSDRDACDNCLQAINSFFNNTVGRIRNIYFYSSGLGIFNVHKQATGWKLLPASALDNERIEKQQLKELMRNLVPPQPAILPSANFQKKDKQAGLNRMQLPQAQPRKYLALSSELPPEKRTAPVISKANSQPLTPRKFPAMPLHLKESLEQMKRGRCSFTLNLKK